MGGEAGPISLSNLRIRQQGYKTFDGDDKESSIEEKGPSLLGDVGNIFAALLALTDDQIKKTEFHLWTLVRKEGDFSSSKEVNGLIAYINKFNLPDEEGLVSMYLEQQLKGMEREDNSFAIQVAYLEGLAKRLSDLLILYRFYAEKFKNNNGHSKKLLGKLESIYECVANELDARLRLKNTYRNFAEQVLTAFYAVTDDSIEGTKAHLSNENAKISNAFSAAPRRGIVFSRSNEVTEFIHKIEQLAIKDHILELDFNTKAALFNSLLEKRLRNLIIPKDMSPFVQQEQYLLDLKRRLDELILLYESASLLRHNTTTVDNLKLLQYCIAYQLAPLAKNEDKNESSFFDYILLRPVAALGAFVVAPIVVAALCIFLGGPVGMIVGASILAAEVVFGVCAAIYTFASTKENNPSMKQFLHHDPDALPIDFNKGQKSDIYNGPSDSCLTDIKMTHSHVLKKMGIASIRPSSPISLDAEPESEAKSVSETQSTNSVPSSHLDMDSGTDDETYEYKRQP